MVLFITIEIVVGSDKVRRKQKITIITFYTPLGAKIKDAELQSRGSGPSGIVTICIDYNIRSQNRYGLGVTVYYNIILYDFTIKQVHLFVDKLLFEIVNVRCRK